MLDLKKIRENPDYYRNALARRNNPEVLTLIDSLVEFDARKRVVLQEVESLRMQRNRISREVGAMKKEGQDATALMKDAELVIEQIKNLDLELASVDEKVKQALLKIPNIPLDSVPDGSSEEDNVEVKVVGEKTKPGFELKAHADLAENVLRLADFSKAGEVSGAGFNYLFGDLARLDRAIQDYAVDYLEKKGFTLVHPPYMLRKEAYEGAVDLDAFKDVIYKVDEEDLYLIATSEHPIAALKMNEVLSEDDLPLKFVGVSPCFRKEIGSKNVDTRGFYRMHQFNKVEQFVYCKPEDSEKEHEKLLKNTEGLWKGLGIPYRVVNLCGGDLGGTAAKTYDLEAWFPRQQLYGEVASCSTCTDYQARRLNIKYGKIGAQTELVHTLNSTAIPTSRALVAILENYQEEDGSVKIPSKLQKYMNKKKKITPLN